MTVLLSNIASFWRRKSRLANLCRNFSHIVRCRRVSLSAWLLVDGQMSLGRRATISRGCRIAVPTNGILELETLVWLNHDVEIEVLRRIAIGSHTTVQRHCSLIGDVEVGRGCLLAPNVFISSGRHNFDAWPAMPIRLQDALVAADTALRASQSRPVRIGDDCWIGVNSTVLPGVTIGRGAIVGANTVVVRDVQPYEVVGGVPARLLRRRIVFEPPGAIDGLRQDHWPYFYSGFEFGDACPPVANGDFVLALALAKPSVVQLTLRGLDTSPVEITCCGIRGLIPAFTTIDIQLPAAEIFEINRLRVRLPAGGRIQVLGAVVRETAGVA
jgi:acetyltransferase-like isoleucine patch superfamily enzyme